MHWLIYLNFMWIVAFKGQDTASCLWRKWDTCLLVSLLLNTSLSSTGWEVSSLSSSWQDMKPSAVCCLLFLALLAVLPVLTQDLQHVEERGKKGQCTNTGPDPDNKKIFAPFTQTGKKGKSWCIQKLNEIFLLPDCPCWWNLSLKICACCKGANSMQCGFPMHKFCYKKTKMVGRDNFFFSCEQQL